jgi:hypothetical protein
MADQSQTTQSVPTAIYADKEMPINVLSDLENLNLGLPLAVPGANAAPGAIQTAQPATQ